MIVDLRRDSPMRTVIIAASIGLVASFIFSEPVRSENPPAGTPLLRNKMKEWSRYGGGKNPWVLNADGVLWCNGNSDTYCYDEVLGNGNLHLEWRFVPTAKNAKKVVNASVVVRAVGESERCKVLLGTDCGSIVCSAISSSDRAIDFESKAPKALANDIGDWNSMDIKMTTDTLLVTVNGKQAASTLHSKESGIFFINAEGDPIEFRNIRWKAAR